MHLMKRLVAMATMCLLFLWPTGAATAQDNRSPMTEASRLTTQVRTLYRAGRYDEAIPLARQVVEILEKELGPADPLLASALSTLAGLFRAKSDYVQAEPLYQRALEIREKAPGTGRLDLAVSLDNLAGVLVNEVEYARAEQLYKRALEIREQALGPGHLNVATSLDNLAGVYDAKGDYAQAEQLFKRASSIREKVLSADDPEISVSLNKLAELYRTKGDYARAEPLYRRALEIREKALGPEHLGISQSLNNLALLYYDKGDYAQAEPLFRRALALDEKLLGPQDPLVASTLSNLAELYHARGDYAQAELLHKRALSMREQALGAEHLDVAVSLNNLAGLYRTKGDYLQAEPLYRRALSIHEKLLGPGHPNVATSLNNLALLYEDRGDYARAEPLLQRALTIREKVFGAGHHSVAASFSNLAGLYYHEGDYPRAEALFKQSWAIAERALGAEHLDVAVVLDNLAALYEAKGDHGRAEPLHKRALAIREKALGADHPDVASSLNNLANLYRDKGDYRRAEPLFKRAWEIREKALGQYHPEVAASFVNLADLYYARGDRLRATQALASGDEIEEHNLALMLTTGSEDQKQLYLNTLSGTVHVTVSLHVRYAPRDEQAARLAFLTILRRKGRALDAMTDQIGALRRHATPQDQTLLNELSAARSQLATLQISGWRRLAPEARRAEVARLTAEVERLEAEVGRRSSEFRAQSQSVTPGAVRAAIPADAALVEFFAYRPFDAKAQTKNKRFASPRYVAYVARRDEATPSWVELGDAARIDEALTRWRQALGNPPLRRKGEQVSDTELRRRLDRHEAKVKELARALDERVMRPVRRLLGETRHILLSPDGALNLIPFTALVDEQGDYLIRKYSITYLTSGRDLLRLQARAGGGGAPLVIADPLYDLAAEGGPASKSATDESRRSMDFTLKSYPPLPGTEAEAAALNRLLPDALVLTRDRATEAAVKQVSRPRLLHIATHGFFLSEQVQAPTTGDTLRRETLDTLGAAPLPAQWENPLLRSGLVLAGVKQGQSGSAEDGVLTALEVAGLDLWGTQLVVLSACETALGDPTNGAGVYGLRRALVLAGSEAQIMSLWKVSDAGTRDLMTNYYERLLRGEGRTEALRQVQLEMLNGRLSPATGDKRREGRDVAGTPAVEDYHHPYYWAAFIQSGDWRSLDGK
jgi:tetratricopeptide (TPR) repeat protein